MGKLRGGFEYFVWRGLRMAKIGSWRSESANKKGWLTMNVRIKSFDVNMEVKKSGIEFEVRTPDGKEQLGDCYLTMTGLIWCQGRKKKGNGVKVGWNDFIAIMCSKDALKRALKAARSSGSG